LGWDIPVDIYCERIDATFWSEPLNALTNAAFIIAACAAALRYRAAGVRDRFLQTLIGIVALIGIGSFAFHTLATRGAVLLDVIPITIFIYAYLALALSRFIGLGFVATAVLFAAFFAFSYGLSALVPRPWLNGSIDYLPPPPRFMLLACGHKNLRYAAESLWRQLCSRSRSHSARLILRRVMRFRLERISCGTC
jgi:hypothetical protein